MSEKFTGLNDKEWSILESIVNTSKSENRKGRPPVSKRKVLNSILYVLINGSRWSDIPVGEQWASRSTAHRWLIKWVEDGTLNIVLKTLKDKGFLDDKINLDSSIVEAFRMRKKG